MGQSQKEREQEKKPHTDGGLPDMDQVEITPIDDLMEELNRVREHEKQQDKCHCYGDGSSSFSAAPKPGYGRPWWHS